MIGVWRPSASTNGRTLVAIRPVAMTTGTPRATTAATALRVRSRIGAVVVDEGPVEVEGDEADREARLGLGGRRPRRRPCGTERGSGTCGLLQLGAVARCARRAAGRRGRGRPSTASRGAAPATSASTASAWSEPISRRIVAPGARTSGSRSSRRRIVASPSAPPSSAMRGSNEAAMGSVVDLGRRDVRQVGEEHVEGERHDRRQQVGLDEAQPVGDPVADRVLAGELRGPRPRCRSRGSRRRRRPGACAARRRARRRSCRSPSRRRRCGWAARRPAAGRAVRRSITSRSASSTMSSVSGRGMSARASAEKASP